MGLVRRQGLPDFPRHLYNEGDFLSRDRCHDYVNVTFALGYGLRRTEMAQEVTSFDSLPTAQAARGSSGVKW